MKSQTLFFCPPASYETDIIKGIIYLITQRPADYLASGLLVCSAHRPSRYRISG